MISDYLSIIKYSLKLLKIYKTSPSVWPGQFRNVYTKVNSNEVKVKVKPIVSFKIEIVEMDKKHKN